MNQSVKKMYAFISHIKIHIVTAPPYCMVSKTWIMQLERCCILGKLQG